MANGYDGDRRQGAGCFMRLAAAGLLALVSVIGYCSLASRNEVTGKKQYVALSVEQEVAMGMQAAPDMAQQFGGLDRDPQGTARVEAIGRQLVESGAAKKTRYEYRFHLLADRRTVNAFALPGGQIFITRALYDLIKTDGQLAGVLGHEVGHVIERHSAQQMAEVQLANGLTGAAIAATYDPNDPQSRAAAIMMIEQLVNLRYSRKAEYEADVWGVRNAAAAGYDPRALIDVMKLFESLASAGGSPEFLNTHPSPPHRIAEIQKHIEEEFPNGLPAGLKP